MPDARVGVLLYIYRPETEQATGKKAITVYRKCPFRKLKLLNKITLNNNTVYISFDGLSDPLGQSQILPYLLGLSVNGYRIHVFSCEKEKNLTKEKTRIESVLKNHHIGWTYILYDENGSFLSRISYVNSLTKLVKNHIRKFPVSLIHCRSYLAALIGLSFKQKYNIPFVFDMRGFWADERLDGNIWKKSNPVHLLLYRFFKSKEQQFLKSANAVVSLTKAGLAELNHLYPTLFLSEKTSIIPCCTNTEIFNPDKIDGKYPTGINPTDFYVIYTGSVGTWYYTKELIDCVYAWKSLIPEIKLLILTKDREALHEILQALPDEKRDFVFSESAAYHEVPMYLKSARASVFFIKPAYSKIASSPTKMAECWSMNLPIITNAGIGDNNTFFNELKGGVMIHEFSETEYLKAGKALLELLNQKNNFRKLALEHFDVNIAISRYTEIYKRITQNPV
jgi:hypothetical protein